MDELDEVDGKLSHYDLQVKDPLYLKLLPYKNKLGKHFPKSNFEWDSKTLLQNKEFENMLVNYLIYSKFQYERLLDIKSNIIEMITIINDE